MECGDKEDQKFKVQLHTELKVSLDYIKLGLKEYKEIND